MKYHVTAKIVEITEWEHDRHMMAGDASHVEDSHIIHRLADEIAEKQGDPSYSPPGLPFEYEFDIEPDFDEWITKDEIKDYILDEYVTEFMEYDYVKPCDCEIEIISIVKKSLTKKGNEQ